MPDLAHPPLPFHADLTGELATLSRDGLLRSAQPLPEGLVSFASNDYLGLARDPRVAQAAAEASREFGSGSGSSRLIAGTGRLALRFEEDLAAFKGFPSALTFASGYQAAVGTISALVGPGDDVYLDKLDHASLIDGARLSRARLHTWPHGQCLKLRRLLDRPAAGRRLVVTDGLFSMDGDVALLQELGELAVRFGAALMVDEAHATGCLGSHGRGVAEHLGCENLVHISMGTLSKALGSQGGFIAADRTTVEYLVNRARAFMYTTAPAPTVLAAALSALEIVRSEPERRERLAKRAFRLRQALQEQGFDIGGSSTHIIPVVLGDNDRALAAAVFLRKRGILAPAVRYPTVPRGAARLRISISSEHSESQIDSLVSALRAWRDSSG